MSVQADSPRPIVTAFRELLERAPDTHMFTFVGADGRDEESLTARQLADAAASVARSLRTWGVSAGDRVVLVYPPSLDFVKALLGCLVAGVVPVPVYPPNPFRPGHELVVFSAILGNSGARAVLTSSAYDRARTLGMVSGLFFRDKPAWPRTTWYRTDRRPPRGAASVVWHQPVDLNEPAVVQYSSGSTSAPKGVVISHGNLAHEVTANARDLGLGPGTRGVFWVPQYHDLGMISVILSTIAGNGTAYLMSPLTFMRRPDVWFDVMSRVRATHTAAPNFAYELAVRKTTAQQRAGWDLSAVRVVMSAAEPIKAATMRAFYQAFAATGLRRETFYPAYGLAEHTVSVSMGGVATLRLARATLEQGVVRAVTDESSDEPVVECVGCGRTGKPGECVRIVDPDTRRPVEPGHVGEIWVDSPTKALGYLGMPKETNATFRAKVVSDDDPREYLRTGDLGFVHDGELFVCGRHKDMLVVLSRNVYPLDIEDSVRDCHPLIRPGGLAAFGVPAPDDDTSGDRLVIFVETRAKPVEPIQVDEIIAAVRDRVRANHQLDCHAIVVGRPGLVRKTTSGKVRRRSCAEAFLSGSLAGSALVITTAT